MNWKKKCLENFKLYAITDLRENDPKILEKIEGALRGGVDIIQLRSKILSDRSLVALGKKILTLTRKMKRLFIVNDRVDLMKVINADGVHLGQNDLAIQEARRLIKDSEKIIGQSTHTLKQAIIAARDGADYIGFGPIFSTPTKPTYQAVGLDEIRQVVKRVQIPVVCIGGIDSSNIRSVVAHGANRVAVVRAIFSVAGPYQVACDLRKQLEL